MRGLPLPPDFFLATLLTTGFFFAAPGFGGGPAYKCKFAVCAEGELGDDKTAACGGAATPPLAHRPAERAGAHASTAPARLQTAKVQVQAKVGSG